MDLQTRWVTALGVAAGLAAAAVAGLFVISVWVGVAGCLLLAAAVLVWGQWPQIRARHPKVQPGIEWTKEPRHDGVRITLRSDLSAQQGFFLAYFGGPVEIEEVLLEAPIGPGKTIKERIGPPFTRATESEIVVVRSTVPSNTVLLKLLASKQVHVTEVRHLQPGDLERQTWKPLQ